MMPRATLATASSLDRQQRTAATCPYPFRACSWARPLGFCVSDLARTDVAAHLGCGWDRLRRAAPRWERAELFLEFVGDPAGLVAALVGDVGEHPVPALAQLR